MKTGVHGGCAGLRRVPGSLHRAHFQRPQPAPLPTHTVSLRFVFSSEPKDQTSGEQSQMELAAVMNRTSAGPLPWP